MSTVRSMEDYLQIQEQIAQRKQATAKAGNILVIVGMGMCGVAAGAGKTVKAIRNFIERNNLSDVIVTQAGCIGLCEKEPIIQVIIGENPKIVYGKVTPEVAERIFQEHIQGGKSLPEYVIEM